MADNESNSPIGTQVLSSLPSSMPDDSFYTLIVDGDNQGFDSETRYIPLDFVSSVRISASSNITTYPIITGDIISDHKYDEPKNVEISGKFGLNGKFASSDNPTFAFSGDKSSRLKNIEDYFFALRKYGKFITLISSLDGNSRFSTIDNLVISNLSFTRNFNTLDFNLTLKEIYTYENDNEVDILENVSDPNLPVLGSFKSCDFAKDVLTYDSIDEMVITKLCDNGLIAESFGELVANQVIAGVSGKIVLGIVVALIIVKVTAKVGLITATTTTAVSASLSVMVGLSSVPVVGWVALGIGAVVLIGLSVWNLMKYIKKRQLISEFKAYANDKDNYNESERMKSLLTSVRNAFDDLAENNNIKFYKFSSNTTKQETYLTIDDNLYCFRAEQTSSGWSLQIINNSDNDSVVETRNTNQLVGNTNLMALTPADAIFGTDNGTYVYVLNKALIYASEDYPEEDLKTMLEDCWKQGSLGYLGYSEEVMKNTDDIPIDDIVYRFKKYGVYKDLTQFVFVVTPVVLTELDDALKETILNCFRKEGGN